jgi:cytochrome c553
MTDPDIAEIAAYIAAQQAADPTFKDRVVWEEYTYERGQQ